MSRDFNRAYGRNGQVSIPPEALIKCLLLRALFGIPSERRLCEACEFNLLYRWFIDWSIEKPMWTPEVFSMNRERFELHGLVRKFFDRVVAEGIGERLVRDDRRRSRARGAVHGLTRGRPPLLGAQDRAASRPLKNPTQKAR